MEKLLTVPQVAELFSVSRSLVYKWVHYGYVPYIKIGTQVRFRASDLERWVSKKMHRGRAAYKLSAEMV